MSRQKLSALTLILLGVLLQSCATSHQLPPVAAPVTALYIPAAGGEGQELLHRFAPCFVVEDYQNEHNRIGTPAARPDKEAGHEIHIDTGRPAIYTLVQNFSSEGNDFTNLIYRIHFPAVPWPHLTLGRNSGLLVYVTLNDRREPILITTLHTCGCYLAMVPTSLLPPEGWPPGWPADSQEVYGEILPGRLQLGGKTLPGCLLITLRGDTHRVKAISVTGENDYPGITQQPARLLPMRALDEIPWNDARVSFFEREGWRRGYVKGSSKPLERLFISWWAFDPLVGVDKALGAKEETGATFYTSLKFWAREESNIWNFPRFLNYWGWQLKPAPTDDSQLQSLVSR